MFICSKCKNVVSLEDLAAGGTVGNNGSIFCPTCNKEVELIKKELGNRFPNPSAIMCRYVELVASGIDPAGKMYPVYFDNNLIIRERR